MTVQITESAHQQIEHLCLENQKIVRLSVVSGGCNGFNKIWELTETADTDDLIFHCGKGQLLIDQISMELLENSTIDYKNELGGSYFTVAVPSAKSSCGCGSSFSI